MNRRLVTLLDSVAQYKLDYVAHTGEEDLPWRVGIKLWPHGIKSTYRTIGESFEEVEEKAKATVRRLNRVVGGKGALTITQKRMRAKEELSMRNVDWYGDSDIY